jgi:hypothetical protein
MRTMAGNPLFGLIIFLLLLFGVFIAGCSDESPSAGTAIPTPVSPVAKYREGDIIGTASTSESSSLYFILKYDAAADQYTRALIEKNPDGTWGYRPSDRTDTIRREVAERMYPVRVGHVAVSAVPVGIQSSLSESTQIPSGNAPVITKISPVSASRDTAMSMTITGANFRDGATVRLVQPGSAPLTATSVSVSDTGITCFFDLSGKSTGAYNLIVTNPDGQSDSRQNIFTIGEALPIITGVNPVTGELGKRVPVAIFGQNFRNSLKVSFTKGTIVLVCTNPISQESSKISCNLDLNTVQGASSGEWTVTVLNVDDQTKGTWPKKFVVTNATSGSS